MQVRPIRVLALLTLGLGVWSVVYGFQRRRQFDDAQSYGNRRWSMYEYEMQRPADDPPDAWEKTEFAFARLRYRSFGRFGGGFGFGGRRGGGGGSSWGIDANRAERHFVQGVRRLTRLHIRSVEEIVDVDSDEMFNWPWLYAVEVGRWGMSPEQARRIREYLNRGGFLVVDDFHGESEWEIFMEGLRQIYPDRQVLDLKDDEQIFHSVFDLTKRVQVPGQRYVSTRLTYERYDGMTPYWRGVLDEKGRVQTAILFNMDHGDAWEWADYPPYPTEFTLQAYRIGVNYILYSMTH